MNTIYLVKVEDVSYIADYIGEQPRYESEDLVELVVSPTRGKAKSLFWSIHKKEDIEWNLIHTMKIVPVDLDSQIVLSDHPLYETFWELADEKIDKMSMIKNQKL